jgi:AcrR family transcriptional regulator
MQLYSEQGFDETTVAEIAERAGLTERTFFRHFADKREVLFSGSEVLQEAMLSGLRAAPASAYPLDAVALAIKAGGEIFKDRLPFSARRQAVISANTELQERELIKLARLAVALRDGLRSKGVDEVSASIAAETGIAIFKVAFDKWVSDASSGDFSTVISESFDQLKAVTRPSRRSAGR